MAFNGILYSSLSKADKLYENILAHYIFIAKAFNELFQQSVDGRTPSFMGLDKHKAVSTFTFTSFNLLKLTLEDVLNWSVKTLKYWFLTSEILLATRIKFCGTATGTCFLKVGLVEILGNHVR